MVAMKGNEVDTSSVDSLIEELKSKDGLVRQKARNALVRIGEPASDALLKAFEDKSDVMHWEVAKALSQIGSAKAGKTLIQALEDKEFSVRWIGAEGLIHMGQAGVQELLKALIERPDSVWLREGAHHVFHDLIHKTLIDAATREQLTPVLEAINHLDPVTETNWAARKALEKLQAG
jgi:HEAT repeat protein